MNSNLPNKRGEEREKEVEGKRPAAGRLASFPACGLPQVAVA